ncbi:3-deoxy-manno-octulosonate cytidylyltransferase [Yunchengibacter salinarum]|uniref:3-deoxy-manno-octulosonate cytidylyltransferase n=1 Tax=Yunchengibacter salinarum TaxID=3133399 RepID=UPI0035B607F6
MRIVIPARFGSTRLEGKPLRELAGRPLVEHVWRRALEAVGHPGSIVVTSEDSEVLRAAKGFGASTARTDESHQSGTDRVAEVARELGWADDEVVVNLQGDEPFMPAYMIRAVAEGVTAETPMATIAVPMADPARATDAGTVKVVMDARGRAAWFSRLGIPIDRDGAGGVSWFQHVGLYAYRVSTLSRLTTLPPSPAEQAEKLEQLRALHHGIPIQVVVARGPAPLGVDTPADLAEAERLMQESGSR